MILFDFSDDIQVDLESIEAIRLDKSAGVPIVYAIGKSGNEYMVRLGAEAEFFTKIKQLERSTEIGTQITAL